MKRWFKILLTIVSVVLMLIGTFNVLFGENPIAVAIVELLGGVVLFALCAFSGDKWRERSSSGKVRRILCIVLAGVFLVSSFSVIRLGTSTEGIPVADYDKKVNIWSVRIPGNHSDSKLDSMNINKNSRLLGSTIRFVTAIVGSEYRDAEQDIDTFTYLHGILGGYEKETFEDIPYLIPYTVESSDSAVIIVPGGGYGYKSMDGGTGESRDVALALNKAGINAFVLWYRSNPYERPIPQLDLQRAIRYLRYHAAEYGIDSDKIGLIGFSAGGYQIGSFINQIQGNDYFPDSYIPDEIDTVDDSVTAVGMIYPALTYKYNVPMLFSSFDANDVRNEEKRSELLELTDLSLHINSRHVKQFICYGTADTMVEKAGIEAYIDAAQKAGVKVVDTKAEGENHGFAQKYYMENFIKFLRECWE